MELLARWDGLVQQTDGQVPAALLGRVKPILAWRAKEAKRRDADAQFQAALDDLQAALAQGAAVDGLRGKWAALKQQGRPIPLHLNQQYQAALAGFEQEQK